MTQKYVRIPGQGRIYRRSAVWYVDYWVDGQRKQERASRDKEEAFRILAAKRTDVERGNLGFEKKQVIHFSDFAEEYKKIKAGSRSVRTMRIHLEHLKAFFGELPLSKITPELVEEYKQKRLKDKVGGKKKATRTVKGPSINRELSDLKCLFNTARKMRRFRGENPVENISFYPEQARDYVLSMEEVGRLLEAAGEPLRKIILIALNTGLRKGEILGLRWSQVNLDEKVLTFARTKSAKFLRVPANPIVDGILAGIERKGDYVFLGRWGRGHVVDCKKDFEAARKKAGLPELHFHDLRHCAGTYMDAAGVSIRTIQQILGHQNIRTTERYVNPRDERHREAVNALAALFGEPQKPGGPETSGTNVGQAQSGEGVTVELSRN